MAIRIGNFSRFDGPRKGFTPPRSRVIFPGHYMKAPWIVLLTVLAGCAVALGIKWQTEMTRANSLAGIVAKIEAQNTKLTQDLAVAKERVSSLESESQQLRAARAMRRVRLEPGAAPDAAATPDDTKPKGRDGFLAKMFKDPEMRKMLAAQQAAALRGFYSDFVKQAHMTPDEADKFFQLLQERQMALMDSSANMLAGSPIDVKSATAATNTADDALKDLLGPDRFTQYQAFEKTLGDRIQVQQFSQQLAVAGLPEPGAHSDHEPGTDEPAEFAIKRQPRRATGVEHDARSDSAILGRRECDEPARLQPCDIHPDPLPAQRLLRVPEEHGDRASCWPEDDSADVQGRSVGVNHLDRRARRDLLDVPRGGDRRGLARGA